MRLIPPAPIWARCLCLAWLLLYMSWYWLAPLYHKSQGHFDEAAWLPLFHQPTLITGIPVGVLTVLRPQLVPVIIFAAFTLIHLAIGLGFHPT
jgi:hypothetical protein